VTLPIIHEIDSLYKELYLTRGKIPKPDRFGIWSKIENITIECLELAIKAALTAKDKKLIFIQKLKIQIETGKRLTRLTWELKIIADKKYWELLKILSLKDLQGHMHKNLDTVIQRSIEIKNKFVGRNRELPKTN